MSFSEKLKELFIGKAKSPLEKGIFHRLSFIAFFAWVGLGADGLSSSCYGPEQAFLALGAHPYLSLFVALASALTVFVISASYSQIIELFPSGGGGYLVASKLLSPHLGMISGCALLIDYMLTITISIASGADALFSFLPPAWQTYKLGFQAVGVVVLILMNMRGVKESVMPLVPIFMTFVITHLIVIAYAIMAHAGDFDQVVENARADIGQAYLEVGVFGIIFLILRAYSVGAGTFTGIEAVSNGVQTLREPKVITGKRTMRYMAFSLAFTVVGLIIAYLLFGVSLEEGKTLNGVLFQSATSTWPPALRSPFVLITLISEGALLFVAAQTGFIDGPRVLANMSVDRWFPTRFATLSDRLVVQNGVLILGTAALATMALTRGDVGYLVVLYSINVFITYCLSQAGMVRHWWKAREKVKGWRGKITVNGLGLLATSFILFSVVVIKFHEGGWITLFLTVALVLVALLVKRPYLPPLHVLRRLEHLVQSASSSVPWDKSHDIRFDPDSKTAVLFVNGFNGLGLHTLFNVIRLFGKEFKNFVFVYIGVIDAGNFKGAEEIENLKAKIRKDVDRYVEFVKRNGYYADGLTYLGIDVISEADRIADGILKKYPGAVFFGGQLVFPQESLWTKWLHNFTIFTMQRHFYHKGIPFVILPIRV